MRPLLVVRVLVLPLLWGVHYAVLARVVEMPRPLTVSIDDAGWQGGSIIENGPYRLGIDRNPTLDDYRKILHIAKASGTRIMMAWILSELDRSNICAKPEYNEPWASVDITEFGLNWDNSQYVNDGNFELMGFARDESAYLEFGLHGVRHEHFKKGLKMARAEFGPAWQAGGTTTWGIDKYKVACDCFTELLRQYYSPDVCSFPKSFVPPAHGYYYNTRDPHRTTGSIVSSYGVKYIQRPAADHFDGGAFSVDRNDYSLSDWNEIGKVLTEETPEMPYYMTHVPNFMANESDWIKFLRGINRARNSYLPKNTVQVFSQRLYNTHTRIQDNGEGTVTVDSTAMVQAAYDKEILSTLVLKIPLKDGQHISKVTVDKNATVVSYWEDEFDHAYLVVGHDTNIMGRLSKDVYTLRYETGVAPTSNIVHLGAWTYDVHSLRFVDENQAWLTLEMYGEQTVELRLDQLTPVSVLSTNPRLSVRNWVWKEETRTVEMTVHGLDMQGEVGTLIISGDTAATSKVPIDTSAVSTLSVSPEFAQHKQLRIVLGGSELSLFVVLLLGVTFFFLSRRRRPLKKSLFAKK